MRPTPRRPRSPARLCCVATVWAHHGRAKWRSADRRWRTRTTTWGDRVGAAHRRYDGRCLSQCGSAKQPRSLDSPRARGTRTRHRPTPTAAPMDRTHCPGKRRTPTRQRWPCCVAGRVPALARQRRRRPRRREHSSPLPMREHSRPVPCNRLFTRGSAGESGCKHLFAKSWIETVSG